MKSLNLLLVVVGILLLVVLGGALLLSSRSQRIEEGKVPASVPESRKLTEEEPLVEKEAVPPPVPGAVPETGAEYSAALEDRVGGNRSGKVSISSDPFTGESVYSITVRALPKPEGIASYHVWINRVDEGVATDQGKLEVDENGTGTYEFNNVSPKAGWQVRITYQPTEDPTPGTIVLAGTLKKE